MARNVIERMIGPLAHRGPDDSGAWVDDAAGVALGHRRLSIIDLSPAGHEPMISDSGRLVVTFNGEIYNHHELRSRIEAGGNGPPNGWRGHSDIETLLCAIDRWGLDRALEDSIGMFAFALWDRRARKLTLVRDRFGEKPLYYGWVGGDFAFASELKALTAHPKFDNEIDRRAVAAFAERTYVPAPLSVYRRIFKLEPGAILEVPSDSCHSATNDPPSEGNLSNGIQMRRYWNYGEVVRRGLSEPVHGVDEAVELLGEELGAAIRGQSTADVPVGAFLSGGIDSSTIVALYQKYSRNPVRTFTIGFREPGFNEAEHAKRVAEHLGTVHDERYITVEEARDVIPKLGVIYDEPFADSSQIPTFLVSRFAREQVKVVLSGDGGDELFGGYRRHVLASQIWRLAENVPFLLREKAGRALSHLPSRFWTQVARIFGKRGDHWGGVIQETFRAAGSSRDFEELYCSYLSEWAFEPSPAGSESEFGQFRLQIGAPAPAALRGMYCDALSYLPDDILCKVDRAAMAVSLETRVPFLNHRVAQVAARIPLSMKISGNQGKQILRRLLARELPHELFERPKAGFSVPVGDWIKGPLRPWAENLLDPQRLAREGWFDAAIVQRRWRQHLNGQRSSAPALWAILMFNSWLDEQRTTNSVTT